MEPTAEMMAVDIADDLALATRIVSMLREDGTPPDIERDRVLVAEWMERCIPGWPVALIRAIRAEARVRELEDALQARIRRDAIPFAVAAELLAADAEVGRLKGIINGLCDRVATQSELLTRRAEK